MLTNFIAIKKKNIRLITILKSINLSQGRIKKKKIGNMFTL